MCNSDPNRMKHKLFLATLISWEYLRNTGISSKYTKKLDLSNKRISNFTKMKGKIFKICNDLQIILCLGWLRIFYCNAILTSQMLTRTAHGQEIYLNNCQLCHWWYLLQLLIPVDCSRFVQCPGAAAANVQICRDAAACLQVSGWTNYTFLELPVCDTMTTNISPNEPPADWFIHHDN